MLGDFLREHKDEVLALARASLQEKMPDRPEPEVVNHVPGVIDHLIRELSDDAGEELGDPGAIEAVAAEHGRQREDLGIDLAAVAGDYGAVCDAISEVAKRHELDVPAAEWQTLNRALDTSIA